MKKICLLLISLLFLNGCARGESNYDSVQDKLMNMTAYSADVEINYINGGENAIYKVKQTAANDGRYKMVTYYPENLKDCAILFDGKLIWQYNPNVEKKIQVNSKDKPERSQLVLFTFLENYVKSINTTVTTAKTEGQQCVVLEAEINSGDKFMAKEKLWAGSEDMLPKRLVIYDGDGNETIVVTFNSFEYNPKLLEDEFVPQK